MVEFARAILTNLNEILSSLSPDCADYATVSILRDRVQKNLVVAKKCLEQAQMEQ